MKDFNLFRLNCLLADQNAMTFKGIIISLVEEYLLSHGNKYSSREKCYSYISDIIDHEIEKDQFDTVLEKANQFEFEARTDEVFIRISDNKYKRIKERSLNDSLDVHISRFIEIKQLPGMYIEKFINLIYESIYTNISSFSTQNLKSIIRIDKPTNFTKEEIESFNEFMDWDDRKKDNALFSLFYKTIEFAIVTAGRGTREFSEKIFEGKEFLLDANIIFRLIGVGGEERKKSLEALLKSCKYQGIKLQYSMATYKEVIRKIDNSINEIQTYSKQGSIPYLNIVVDKYGNYFNNDFLFHYCTLLNKGVIKSVRKYDLFLRSEFKRIDEELGLEKVPVKDKLDGLVLNKLSNTFYNEKKAKQIFKYSKSAAEVDAINVLQVRRIRGKNDYNYSDIKSFYLTTDRILHRILSEDETRICETLLPSQLFILHSALYQDDNERDFRIFTNFLKRRTADYKYTGKEVLDYIDEIREYTTDEANIVNILKAYADKRYETSLEDGYSKPEFISIREFAQSYLEEELNKALDGNIKYQNLYQSAQLKLKDYLIQSRKIARVLDIAIFAFIIPTSSYFISLITDITFGLILFIILELSRFMLSIISDGMKSLWKFIFMEFVRHSSFKKLVPFETEYELEGNKLFDLAVNSLWGKLEEDKIKIVNNSGV